VKKLGEDSGIRERLAIVETEMRFVKNNLSALTGEVKSLKETTEQKYHTLTEAMSSLTSVVDGKLRGSLSGKEKVSIIIALITSLASIAIAMINCYFG